ncbi:MAG TPA: hypothetical protein VFO05_13235, partial [Candidatus Limnocylindrales bacterium]|nr:hypothetical protein [Candidatus Limnocylindrales bacterium]
MSAFMTPSPLPPLRPRRRRRGRIRAAGRGRRRFGHRLDSLARPDEALADGDQAQALGQPREPHGVRLGPHHSRRVEPHDPLVVDRLDPDRAGVVQSEQGRRHPVRRQRLVLDHQPRAR